MAEHGTESAYSAGCRCEQCREASSAARRKRKGLGPSRQQRAVDTERAFHAIFDFIGTGPLTTPEERARHEEPAGAA